MVIRTGSVSVACLIDALREIDLLPIGAGKGPQAKTPNPAIVFGGKPGAFPRARVPLGFARAGDLQQKTPGDYKKEPWLKPKPSLRSLLTYIVPGLYEIALHEKEFSQIKPTLAGY